MSKKYKIGMIGLGVMGRNLLLNMADHGHSVVGVDKDPEKVKALQTEAGKLDVLAVGTTKEFVDALEKPRAMVVLVPAGPPVDAVIRDLLPFLDKGDIIIDGGNSFFKDTDLREKTLIEKGIHFVGMGVSGGENGARHGPSLMPGGDPKAYETVRPIFESIAAKVGKDACVSHLGLGSAGHYVKMVHNGIEYAQCQLIAEAYDLMHRGAGLNDDEVQKVYEDWNASENACYLVEITAHIFHKIDKKTGQHLIDFVLDAAKQKGTGMWTSQNSMDLHVPVNTIDISVAWRNLSALKDERMKASKLFEIPQPAFKGDRKDFLKQLKNAFYISMVVTFAQGMAMLRTASKTYGYKLDLENVARIWRGGCIIRAALLEKISAAFKKNPDLENLLFDTSFRDEVMARQKDLRSVVNMATTMGLPAPGLMNTLAYFDAYRSARLPASLIQAQRDYFGAHTYERVDAQGVFHTKWDSDD